jgi:putative Mg2+ transporter-C (MgtC) family protein
MLPNLEILARLLLAALLGSAIGFERERLLWAAGIRTHMLVCVGACLIMIVSSFGFTDIMGTNNVVLDPSPVAAQVVSGIGFLGAGSILLRGNVVRGLTTAASIWAVAGIGLAIGGGLYFAGIASTLVILVILAGVKALEDIYRARNQSCNLEIKAEHGILTPELLKKTLHIRNGQLKRFMVQPSSKRGIDDLHVALARVSPKDVHNFMEKLEGLQAVRGVKRQK